MSFRSHALPILLVMVGTGSLSPAQQTAPAGGGGSANPAAVPAPSGDMLNQLGILPPAPAPAAAETRTIPLRSAWSDALGFRSEDGSFHIQLGGSAQIDSTWLFAPDSAFDLPKNKGISGVGNSSATFLRRVRLRAEGEIYDQFDFIVEYDFAHAANENSGQQPPSFGNLTGAPAPSNVWMQVRDVPFLGAVRFGHMIKPIGMSQNTSQAHLPFLERPDVADAFYGTFDGGYALGVAVRNRTEDERATWQVGVYRPAINVYGVALNKMEWGGRVTTLPVCEDDGQTLVHVGLGTLNGELPENQIRSRARPLLRNGPGYANPILVDTGTINANRQYTIAPEFAAVWGRWSFQAEWTGQILTGTRFKKAPNQSTALLNGCYVEALCFLTGEYQRYDKVDGTFGRVEPLRNFRSKKGEGCSGYGAWQIGARYSYLDLNDQAVQGGTVHNWTAGLNWYLNPNMKVQFNYILEHRDQPGVPPAWINGVGVRGAYEF